MVQMKSRYSPTQMVEFWFQGITKTIQLKFFAALMVVSPCFTKLTVTQSMNATVFLRTK